MKTVYKLTFGIIALFLWLQGNAQSNETFINPVLAGYYPDPSICRVGEDFYLVNSTFSYYPGVPVFHSKDLVHWKQLGHVLDRPEQLQLEGLGVSHGIFAPDISYHEGIFYMVTTLIGNGGNFVVTAENPAGPWSNPVWLNGVNGIDPSLFFDDNGKAYIVYNSDPPETGALYSGHRTIRMYEFDTEKLEIIGQQYLLINGGTDITKKPIWIEGPHIFKKDGYYYLIAAEGGTSDQHSEVVFRSKDVTGEYVSYSQNPILTQRTLESDREYAVTCTGHADIVKTTAGEWWAVFLGCRPYMPYSEGCFNTGRETFMTPVEWNNGWPVINPGSDEVKYEYPRPALTENNNSTIPLNGNFTFKDDFEESTLNYSWIFLRTPAEKWYSLDQKQDFLSIKVRPQMCTDSVNPSFIARRQQHAFFTASVAMEFTPRSENEMAGIVAFQNETHHYLLVKTMSDSVAMIKLLKSEKPNTTETNEKYITIAEQALEEGREESEPVFLRIEGQGSVYNFYHATRNNRWQLLTGDFDGKFLSTRVAGGFVGTTIGMYATSQGAASTNVARFDWFEYSGEDPVYNDKKFLRKE